MKKRIEKVSARLEQQPRFRRVDLAIRGWMRAHGMTLLRISLGIIFLWYGALKLVPGLSPAEDLAMDTIRTITFGLLPDHVIGPVLGVWEVIIGVGLLTGWMMRIVLLLLFLQMPGTFLPLFLFTDRVFEIVPLVPTIEGQYIFKNLILISAGIVLGGFLEKEPHGGIKPPITPAE